MSADPAALQLRLLQTVVEVAAEKNSTLVMPIPVELLRFFDRAARPGAEARPAVDEAQEDRSLPPAVPAAPVPAIPVLSVPAGLPAGNGVTAPLNTAPLNTAPLNTAALNTALVDDAPKAPVTR
jgi:hypothetical protein